MDVFHNAHIFQKIQQMPMKNSGNAFDCTCRCALFAFDSSIFPCFEPKNASIFGLAHPPARRYISRRRTQD